MKIYKILFIGLLISFTTSCKFQEISIGKIQGVKMHEFTKDHASIEFMLPIENPNSFRFKIKKVNLDISINSAKLGEVKRIRKVVVPAKSDNVHSFLVEVKYSNLAVGGLSFLANMIASNTKFKIDGYIKVKAFVIVSKKIEIHENKPINLPKRKKHK